MIWIRSDSNRVYPFTFFYSEEKKDRLCGCMVADFMKPPEELSWDNEEPDQVRDMYMNDPSTNIDIFSKPPLSWIKEDERAARYMFLQLG